jgi:hypothetical protein
MVIMKVGSGISQLEVVQLMVEPIFCFGSRLKLQAASNKQLDRIKFIVYRIIKD